MKQLITVELDIPRQQDAYKFSEKGYLALRSFFEDIGYKVVQTSSAVCVSPAEARTMIFKSGAKRRTMARDKAPKYDHAVNFETLTDVLNEIYEIEQIDAGNPLEDHVTF